MKQFKKSRTRTVLMMSVKSMMPSLSVKNSSSRQMLEEISQCPEAENIRRFEKQLNMGSEIKSKLSDT